MGACLDAFTRCDNLIVLAVSFFISGGPAGARALSARFHFCEKCAARTESNVLTVVQC